MFIDAVNCLDGVIFQCPILGKIHLTNWPMVHERSYDSLDHKLTVGIFLLQPIVLNEVVVKSQEQNCE